MERRRFLSLSAFYTVAAASGTLSACHSGDDHGNGGAPSPTPVGTNAFPQGVASGDPRDVSAVFWTRCVANPGNAASASSPSSIAVVLQLSTQPNFAQLAATAQLNAIPD